MSPVIYLLKIDLKRNHGHGVVQMHLLTFEQKLFVVDPGSLADCKNLESPDGSLRGVNFLVSCISGGKKMLKQIVIFVVSFYSSDGKTDLPRLVACLPRSLPCSSSP